MAARTYDAVVVGAGIAGTATATCLRRHGMSVALLDARHPGWGASGRNPGFLWLQTKAPGLAMRFSLAARDYAGRVAAQFPDFGFRDSGGLILYRDEAMAAVARAFVADRNAAGLPVELVDRTALLDLCPQIGPDVSGAVWNPLDAHQDTARLVALMADEFGSNGGDILAPARVSRLDAAGSTCSGVVLEGGETVSAGIVVVAAGPWSNELLAPLGLAIDFRPTRFEAASAGPAPFRLGPVVAGQSLFRFFTPAGVDPDSLPRDPTERLSPELGFTEQIATAADGTLKFGCAYQVGSTSDQATVAGQAMAFSIMCRNFPALAGLPLQAHWAGVVAQTPDTLPAMDVRCGVDGLAINAGHFSGNLAGAFCGHLMADALAGTAPEFDISAFSRTRFASAAVS
ncbi:FAD-dependent oxidoreductase [Microbaculum marinum]|uniref:FAD-dependent oxidoreductase n=1 Tax=Microbaculum marinum TaxID=1764581 RepID=A0AAW9RB03_9HYPH